MLFLLMDMAETPEEKRKTEALFNKYERLSYYVAGKILTNQQDIEDAVMDAWIKIIKNINKISEISCHETRSFVVIIVEGAAINIYNRNKKYNLRELPLEKYDQSPFFSTKETSFEDVEVYEMLRSIGKEFSDVLILFYMKGMSVKEISDILDISEVAVRKRLQRGREQLTERWKR
ncbi:MAG: sigma-70 family RNA polymerase sigma factor [Eubacterium sp.]|nr:sigma-70 family RNA polymerase sigma factor [Eubacterium sp.]